VQNLKSYSELSDRDSDVYVRTIETEVLNPLHVLSLRNTDIQHLLADVKRHSVEMKGNVDPYEKSIGKDSATMDATLAVLRKRLEERRADLRTLQFHADKRNVEGVEDATVFEGLSQANELDPWILNYGTLNRLINTPRDPTKTQNPKHRNA
jgi:hypothetical protein